MSEIDERIEIETFRAFVALFVIECAYLFVCGWLA